MPLVQQACAQRQVRNRLKTSASWDVRVLTECTQQVEGLPEGAVVAAASQQDDRENRSPAYLYKVGCSLAPQCTALENAWSSVMR